MTAPLGLKPSLVRRKAGQDRPARVLTWSENLKNRGCDRRWFDAADDQHTLGDEDPRPSATDAVRT
jgi:hypothetical protein